MDCFHLWIACFDNGVVFRDGYADADDHPWKKESPEKDVPHFPSRNDHQEKDKTILKSLKRKRQNILQELEDIQTERALKRLSQELDSIDLHIKDIKEKINASIK